MAQETSGVPGVAEPPPPQLSNSAAVAIITAFFGMFVLLIPGAALDKRVFVAGSPSMFFLDIHFAPALQSTWLFQGRPLKSILTRGK
jgi:hypothetical protein